MTLSTRPSVTLIRKPAQFNKGLRACEMRGRGRGAPACKSYICRTWQVAFADVAKRGVSAEGLAERVWAIVHGEHVDIGADFCPLSIPACSKCDAGKKNLRCQRKQIIPTTEAGTSEDCYGAPCRPEMCAELSTPMRKGSSPHVRLIRPHLRKNQREHGCDFGKGKRCRDDWSWG